MTLQEYIASLRGKTVAVIGIGVSNTPLLRLLLREGHRRHRLRPQRPGEAGRSGGGAGGRRGRAAAGRQVSSGPGPGRDFPTQACGPTRRSWRPPGPGAASSPPRWRSFFQVCPCPIIAVTGSGGKTTTTTIIAELLRAAGHTVHVGGNIGHPLLAEADTIRPTDWAVLELSSFQLMTMTHSPHIAVVTNLAPNHLDIHKSMEEYVWAKENIFPSPAARGHRHLQPGQHHHPAAGPARPGPCPVFQPPGRAGKRRISAGRRRDLPPGRP